MYIHIVSKMFLTLFVMLKLLACCIATDCPDGWLAFESSCYLFGADDVHFTEAEHYCRQHNSHLVHVESGEENSFLAGYLNTYMKVNHDYWLGMTDEIAEGVWRWTVNNARVELPHWGPTEPQDLGGHEDCAVFHHSLKFMWADVTCTTNRKALCEKSGSGGNINEVVG